MNTSTAKAKRISAEEQYQLILECRSSGLSDYQWCIEHDIKPGTFYNWVKRLRKKACYDIPGPVGKIRQQVQPPQEVVPLLIIEDDEPTVPTFPKVEQNACILANETSYAAELNCNGISVRISNDISKELLFQIFQCMGGRLC